MQKSSRALIDSLKETYVSIGTVLFESENLTADDLRIIGESLENVQRVVQNARMIEQA